ncbi:M56 family metallopeptidase [Lysobacter cavernae]|uniref:M56 family metallopeptidase n=1 Tax=Lysobacter cavernae TaxID=1685901 RepID=A0ABV7RSP7_9GAMM
MADLLASLVPALGRALLHFLWQGAVIGLVAAIVLQLLSNARPQTRYAVACVALLVCVLAPMASIVAHVGVPAGATAPVTTASMAAPAMASRLVIDPVAWPTQLDNALPWIVALWAAGACVLSLRMAMGLAWIRRLRATPQAEAQAPWQARLDALAVRSGLKPGIVLHLVDSLDSPVSAGWWHPVVLLPTALITRMPTDLIEALLAHELAHIRRHDYLVNLMQGVVEALLFYHPVTWWLSRRIRIEREHIADRLAAEVTGEPRRLALALSELSELSTLNRSSCPPPHLAQAAHGGHLMSRIEQLVRPGHRASAGRIAFPLLGIAAACIAFYAQAQIAKDPPTASSQPRTIAAQTIRLHSGERDEAYALIRKGRDGITLSGSTDDLPAIESARRSLDGDFIWFRRDDKAYVVLDPALITRAEAAWNESRKLGDRMEALGDQMEVHGDKMEVLGEQMEQLSARREDNPAMDAATRRMETLATQQQNLAEKQSKLARAMARSNDAEQEQLSREMDALSKQQDALSQQMDQQADIIDAQAKRLQAQAQPMEALGRQMEAASKPMEALSAQMEVLSKQHEKVIATAERDLQKLINEAMGKGLALPAPGAIRAQ